MGNCDVDNDGMMPYEGFVTHVVSAIKKDYLFNVLLRKKELLDQNRHKIDETHSVVKQLDEMELFRRFKKYDRNSKGVLSYGEYAQCLQEYGMANLNKSEIITATLAADVNQDG